MRLQHDYCPNLLERVERKVFKAEDVEQANEEPGRRDAVLSMWTGPRRLGQVDEAA